jgi:hypothetical protein
MTQAMGRFAGLGLQDLQRLYDLHPELLLELMQGEG